MPTERILETSTGDKPQGRGDWWGVRYRPAGGRVTFATDWPLVFPNLMEKQRDVGAVPAARKASDESFTGSYVVSSQNKAGDQLAPAAIKVSRRVRVDARLPAYSSSRFDEAKARITVDGGPPEAWQLAALEREYPGWFSGRGSGSISASRFLVDPTQTARLELEEVRFKGDGSNVLASAAEPRPARLPTSTERPVTLGATQPVLHASTDAELAPEPAPAVTDILPRGVPRLTTFPTDESDPSTAESGESPQGSSAGAGGAGSGEAAPTAVAPLQLNTLGWIAGGVLALVLLRRAA